ncbi:hypothetical protein HYS94_01060 [Candidatus Daviesbacteria bacterium]|nr:hypothetical protein [Candidatus Daviesbacteria bacterium]
MILTEFEKVLQFIPKNEKGHTLVQSVLFSGLSFLAAAGGISLFLDHQQKEFNRAYSAWTQDIRDGLQDPTILSPDEKFYKKVRVIGAGRDAIAAAEVKIVNVRNYPQTYLDYPIKGGPEIIGTVQVGSEIYNVIMRDGWGAFNCNDANGLTLNDLAKEPPVICVTHGDYLIRVD